MGNLLKLGLLIVVNAGIFWGIDYLFKDNFMIAGGVKAYLFVAIFFGCIDSFIKPIINLVTLPVRLLSFGIIKFFINGGLLLLLEKGVNYLKLEDIQITITGLLTYIIIGFILAIIDSIFDNF